MMKMPKPKPVVRWMKLAPMLSMKMYMAVLSIAFVTVGKSFVTMAGKFGIEAN